MQDFDSTEEITLEQIEIFDAPAAAQALQARAGEARGKLKKLEDEAQKRGYRRAAGQRPEIAMRQKFRSAQPVRPPAGEQGAAVQDLQIDISLRALEKPNSQDQAAIATVTATAGSHTEVYDMLLEAPNGDFAKAREFEVNERDQLVAANSWWTAARSCAIGKCGSVCIGALVACSGTWAAYLLCVAAACGGCWVRCAACATCNCRWWCKWATGCCHQ